MTESLLFFDGVCGLCNHAVNFLFNRDKNHALRFAPLQGKTAEQYLSKSLRQGLDSMVFVKDGQIYVHSEAALRAIAALGGVWRGASVFMLIPRPIRDAVYGAVANSRYQLFGKVDVCRLPSEAEQPYFLD